jgi:hypothetical protein
LGSRIGRGSPIPTVPLYSHSAEEIRRGWITTRTPNNINAPSEPVLRIVPKRQDAQNTHDKSQKTPSQNLGGGSGIDKIYGLENFYATEFKFL